MTICMEQNCAVRERYHGQRHSVRHVHVVGYDKVNEYKPRAASMEQEQEDEETTSHDHDHDHDHEVVNGKYHCRRCSCTRFKGVKERGGYKCENCNHLYEDHREM